MSHGDWRPTVGERVLVHMPTRYVATGEPGPTMTEFGTVEVVGDRYCHLRTPAGRMVAVPWLSCCFHPMSP